MFFVNFFNRKIGRQHKKAKKWGVNDTNTTNKAETISK